MIWMLLLLVTLVGAASAYRLGGRLFTRACEAGEPDQALPSGGCCGFNLPAPTDADRMSGGER